MATKSQLYKGIEIPIGVSTITFNTAFKEIDATINATKKEVQALQSSLKFEYDNSKFIAAQDAAQRLLDETKKRADYLREALRQAMEGDSPHKNEQIQYFNTELQFTENSIKNIEKRITDLNNIRFTAIQNSFKETNAILDVSKEKTELLRDRLDFKIDKNAVVEFQKAAQEQIQKTYEKLEHLKSIMSDIASKDSNAASTREFKELENQVISLENELSQAAKAIQDVNQQRLDAINEQFQKAGDNLNNLSKAVAPVSLAISGALGIGVKSAIDFEQSMSKLENIIGSTGEETEILKTKIRDMSDTTIYSATDIAESAKMVAEAGGDINFMTEQLVQGANLATATQSDLAMSLDFLGSTVKTFKVDAENIRGVTDSITAVTKKANLELPQLSESYKNIGDSAVRAGLDINDTNAILIALSENGHKGGVAGTELNGVLRNLSTPAEKAQEELKKLNVELYEGGKQRDILTVMSELNSVLGTLDDKSRNAAEAIIFDETSLKAWNVIADEGIDSIRELSGELLKSSEAFGGMGQAAGTAAELTNSTASQLTMVKNQLENLSASFGELLLPMIQKITGGVSDFVTWLNSLDGGTKNLILRFGLFVAALAPAFAITGNITKSIGTLITNVIALTGAKTAEIVVTDAATGAQIRLNTAMAANPVGLVVTAIGTLVAILGAAGLVAALDSATNKTDELNKKLGENKKAYEDATVAIDKRKNAEEASLRFVERLIPEYDELNKKVDKTTEEKNRLKAIVEKINEILPNAITLINEETGAYDLQRGSIDELIAAKRRMIQAKFDEQEAEETERRQRQIKNEGLPEARNNFNDNVKEYLSKYRDDLTDREKKDFLVLANAGKIDWKSLLKDSNISNVMGAGTVDLNAAENNALQNIIKSENMIEGLFEEFNKNEDNIKNLLEKSIDYQVETSADGGTPPTETAGQMTKEDYDLKSAELKNFLTKGEITEREYADKVYALKQAYYQNDKKALLDAETEHIESIKRIETAEQKAVEKSEAERKKAEEEAEEKNKTLEELYKEEKNRQDLIFNAKKESEKDYEKLLQDRIALQKKYLTEGTNEWLSAQAEINKLESDIEKTKADNAKKTAEEKSKTEKDNYDKSYQALKEDREDGIKTWEEYYNGLLELKKNNEAYLGKKENHNISRTLDKEIEKAKEEMQSESFSTLTKNFTEGSVKSIDELREFEKEYKRQSKEFYAGNEEALQKSYDNLEKITDNYIKEYISELNAKYKYEEISFEKYREDYLDFYKTMYDENSREYKQACEDMQKASENYYNEINTNLEKQLAAGNITTKEYHAEAFAELEKHFEKSSEEYAKHAADINKTVSDRCSSELSELKKMYNNGLLSLDKYIKQVRKKMAEAADIYGTDSKEYLTIAAEGEEGITNANETQYREEKEYKDWLHSMGVLSDQQYYDDLLGLAVKYLDQDSKLWRDAMLAQYNFKRSEAEKARKAYEDDLKKQQKILDDNLKEEENRISEQRKKIENQYKEELKAKQEAIKEAHNARIKAIDDELSKERFRLNLIIAGINEEIQKRKELREDESQDDKIVRAQKALGAAQAEAEFERDQFTKENLEQEVIRRKEELDKLIQERDDTVFYRNKESEIDQIQEQINNLEDAAKVAKESAQEQRDAALMSAEATDELNSKLKELDDRLGEVRLAYDTQTAAITAAINQQRTEIDIVGQIASGYENLTGSTQESIEAKQFLTEASKEYISKLPEFISEIDLETEAYKRQIDAILAAIEAKKGLASLQAVAQNAVADASSSAAMSNKDLVALINSIPGMTQDDRNVAFFGTSEQRDNTLKKYDKDITINNYMSAGITVEQATKISTDSIKKAMNGG